MSHQDSSILYSIAGCKDHPNHLYSCLTGVWFPHIHRQSHQAGSPSLQILFDHDLVLTQLQRCFVILIPHVSNHWGTFPSCLNKVPNCRNPILTMNPSAGVIIEWYISEKNLNSSHAWSTKLRPCKLDYLFLIHKILDSHAGGRSLFIYSWRNSLIQAVLLIQTWVKAFNQLLPTF